MKKEKEPFNSSLIGDLLSGNFTFQSGQGGMIFPNWLKRNKKIILAQIMRLHLNCCGYRIAIRGSEGL